jgi:hypothetical protein
MAVVVEVALSPPRLKAPVKFIHRFLRNNHMGKALIETLVAFLLFSRGIWYAVCIFKTPPSPHILRMAYYDHISEEDRGKMGEESSHGRSGQILG